MPEADPEIVVVGSANVDMVLQVRELPRPGETVLAHNHREFPGGKGANQAIAAARLGRRVAFVGRIGDDGAGRLVRAALVDEGVDVRELRVLDGEATGKALVMVDAQAENSIVVIGGANAGMLPAHVHEAEATLRRARVVVAQLEVPVETVRAAAAHAQGVFVLNPAPAQPLDDALLSQVDVLVVNEGEFAVVAGQQVGADEHEMTAVLVAASLHPSVVVTLGAQGAWVWHGGRLTPVPAPAVEVVDTTGAGDTFVGALADALARGADLVAAAEWAVCAASLSTGSLGATTAMPDGAAVRELASSRPAQVQGVGRREAPMV